MKNLILLLISIIVLQSCVFAGSYPYAQYYIVDGISETQLVEKVIELKKNYPQYKIVVNGLERVDKIDNDGFYSASFYIKENNINIYAIINLNRNPDQRKKAEIGLHQILDSVKTKDAQFYQLTELSKERRKNVEKIFETEILNKLGTWSRW